MIEQDVLNRERIAGRKVLKNESTFQRCEERYQSIDMDYNIDMNQLIIDMAIDIEMNI